MSRFRLLSLVAVVFSMIALTAAPALAQGGPLGRPQTWVDDELFNGVVTPATFDPASDPFDELYAGCLDLDLDSGLNGFRDGVPLISESKPGDQDYNGGRWHLNVITDTDDCEGYEDAAAFEDLDTADFTSTDTYFECPLLPRRGNNP